MLPDDIQIDKKFDLICLFDVIEHIENDLGALNAINDMLNSSGYVFITVPAYNFLWSGHDELSHHKRRCSRKELQGLIHAAGFEEVYSTYFLVFLFPVVAVIKLISRLLHLEPKSQLKMPTRGINVFLTKLFALEKLFVPDHLFP